LPPDSAAIFKKLSLRSQGGFSPAFSISIAVRIQGLIDRKIEKIIEKGEKF
jgi:hypothetical protein